MLAQPPKDADYEIVQERKHAEKMMEGAFKQMLVAGFAAGVCRDHAIKAIATGIAHSAFHSLLKSSALMAAKLDKSLRIDYFGAVREGRKYCIASFPGKYGQEWNRITHKCSKNSVACVFMQEGGLGFGRHIRPKSEKGARRALCY
mmetsp:Transcript_67088/g.162212  ORF Transcript_67088/g.162212 Transcript_67088/m.162212 type:complete len:146 (+) Transcript_67088:84-521(+)